ncbi:hypothetical protein FHW88_004893 [Mucilaginibacter sp. SG538B]|uniref:hypothetical protein n=1 Tax=Mucilaginibacter sp. SG538B TaxID=2587021 RepID=UPI00159E2E75|nr:hypothetical protein [Mucilaginibacter sp. SG538B]NVM66575.1 hypothetical protein [Mucilaginibacter sp. SG538B]
MFTNRGTNVYHLQLVGYFEASVSALNSKQTIRKNFPDTITEKERGFLQVHLQKQTLILSGEPILKAELDKRKTYYVDSQELFE